MSVSISGKSFRSGLIKRKNNSPYLIGSMSVIPSAKQTKDPAEDQRPGPTIILSFFAQAIML